MTWVTTSGRTGCRGVARCFAPESIYAIVPFPLRSTRSGPWRWPLWLGARFRRQARAPTALPLRASGLDRSARPSKWLSCQEYGKALSRARHRPDGTSGRARLHSASLVILLSTTTTPTRCQESICLVCIKQTVALSDAQIRAAHSFASLARWAALCCAASCHASWRRLQQLSKRCLRHG
jgi:hypothetical protein